MFGIEDIYFADLPKRYPIPYFSYSQLSTFLTCPHSFELTYMSGKFQSRGNKYTAMGSVLHEIFEKQGKQLIAEGEPFTIGKAYQKFNKDFMKVKDEHLEYFTDKDDFIKMYKKGIQALDNFYGVYSETAPLYVEKKFLGRIADDLPDAKSYIDRIDGDPNDASTWIITDYKSGGSAKSKEYLRTDFQLGLYATQVFALTGKYPQAVQFYHPVIDKYQTAIHQGDGVYKFQGQRKPVVEFSVADTIIQIRKAVAGICEAVESGNWKLVPDSWGCKMCFHFEDGGCKPFNKQQQGWASI
ncbi:RecB family exonuclease [Heyndrickxia sporothermodurans]|uniref:RecB family exonuclease n=1 Tax=Heyndrickxia sporothermodurans TaxID=46224 RepID=UPI00192A9002|nr:PD-(D/E)XK nuclease family protein [Heyndrickxia sporothermodurans]